LPTIEKPADVIAATAALAIARQGAAIGTLVSTPCVR
jgi:hypothetical protein